MQVEVKHNGNTVTGHTINYSREHRICTGIGMLEIEFDYTYGNSFDPWDKIEIYENGKKSGLYYVSTVSEGQPNSTIAVTAQDNSKRLSDYFISDSYLIDYPSYNRFWIGYFLEEVGISYRFLTSDVGVLLSNNTALGLMTAYEQMVQLVQMSGWYFTFDYTGKCLIGKADSDFGGKKGSVNNTDILNIHTIKHDQMLRNRVVVWGKGDPESGRWIFADVYKPTKWDYDRKDRRTIVISNANIRRMVDAFALANRALMEFARITVEKHIDLEGARNYIIGDIINVKNLTFTGKGKITTFGTSMSKEGLITSIILDERCPRLFNFWDFTGFIYAGTFGSGVWRKHVNPSWSGGSTSGSGLIGFASGIVNFSGWFDYSSGLMDMSVTDLHVNAGILVSVTSSGFAYYSIEDEHPWSGISISGLTVTYSGNPIEDTVYSSGLMARACIIDRDTNYIRVAVDTRSGENLGDFLMETDPLNPLNFQFSYDTYSGYLASGVPWSGSTMRSWVMDINPYDGIPSGTHSVSLSGLYDFYVYDIENDGTNDYIEAATLGSGLIPISVSNGIYQGAGADWTAQSFWNLDQVYPDNRMYNYMPFSGFPEPILQSRDTLGVTSTNIPDDSITLYDYYPNDGAYAGWTDSNGNHITKWFYNTDSLELDSVTYTKASTISSKVFLSERISSLKFRYYSFANFNSNVSLTANTGSFYSEEYDANDDSLVTTTILDALPNANGCIRLEGLSNSYEPGERSFFMRNIGTVVYIIRCIANANFGFDAILYTYTMSGGRDERVIISTEGTGTTPGLTSFDRPFPAIFSHGFDGIRIICPYIQKTHTTGAFPYTNRAYYKVRRFLYDSKEGIVDDSEIYDWGAVYGPVFSDDSIWCRDYNDPDYIGFTFGNFNPYRQYFRYGIGGITYPTVPADSGEVFVDCFDTVTQTHGKGSDVLSNYSDIVTVRGNEQQAIAKNASDSTFTFIDPSTGDSTIPITTDDGIILDTHLGAVDSFNGDHFYRASISGSFRTAALSYYGKVTRLTNNSQSSLNQQMFGNFMIHRLAGGEKRIVYTEPGYIPGYFPIYILFQRDGDDFYPMKSGYWRERIDISNYSPIVTMDRRISSLATYFVSTDDSVLESTHATISGYNLGGVIGSGGLFNLGIVADDFRYSDFERIAESGSSRELLVVFSGGIGSVDLYTLDSFSGTYLNQGSGTTSSGTSISGIPSGYAKRLEISNYELPDQYLFVAVSGHSFSGDFGWGFYQRDPISGVWLDYSSGYPQARTTILRLDDSI